MKSKLNKMMITSKRMNSKNKLMKVMLMKRKLLKKMKKRMKNLIKIFTERYLM